MKNDVSDSNVSSVATARSSRKILSKANVTRALKGVRRKYILGEPISQEVRGVLVCLAGFTPSTPRVLVRPILLILRVTMNAS